MADTVCEYLEGPFLHSGGLRWYATLRLPICDGDTTETPFRSCLQLHEDGALLGPSHSLHSNIETLGGGRYSHWRDGLMFSTSDGTDPNLNGRLYSVALGEPAPKIIGFGSCHIHAALADLGARGLAQPLWDLPVLSYSPRETFQALQFHLGLLQLPETLREFALISEPARSTLSRVYRDAEIVAIELGTCVDTVYDDFCISRGQLSRAILEPISNLGRAECRIARRWLHQGLLKGNETVRRESADQLTKIVPRINIDPRLAKDIIQNTRGSRQDLRAAADTISAILEVLEARAVCILSTQNLFTPDGRPVTWPGNFRRDLEWICSELGLPLLHQSRLVAERGMAFSLQSDLHHFTPQFLSLMGDEVLALGRAVLRR